jgi:diaminopimelate epimerase
MHGLGNDFVVLDAFEHDVVVTPDLARRIGDRRFGIGCDQILVAAPSTRADARMLIYNQDGSEVEMCGNGIRCLALYLRARGRATGDSLRVETLGGIVTPAFAGDRVRVDMGPPIWDGRTIPVDADGEVIGRPFTAGGSTVELSCVSMGNPHVVQFVASVASAPVHTLGPVIETHPFFPKRTNVEFVELVGPHHVRMRVWERGAGETLACGSGACAVAAVSIRLGKAVSPLTVSLPGGDLELEWDGGSGSVYMTGPGAEVFRGELEV